MLDPLLAYRPAIEAGNGRQGVVLVRIEGDVLHVLCLLLCGGPPQDLLTGTIPCALRASALSSHHFLAAGAVPGLAGRMPKPAGAALLIEAAGVLERDPPGVAGTRPRAVPLPPVTPTAQE